MSENSSQDNKNFLTKPKIVIFGVGGAGGNAINNMISSDLQGVEFVAANTDSQSLENSLATNKIQLGVSTTKGLGAGSFPEKGRDAAEENIEDIKKYLSGANMVFISAGMGGGTGTGAAPVIAKLAREQNILTVGVVTKPFYFEGSHRMEVAEEGVEELKKHVDTLIVIPNQNLFRVSNEQTTFEAAFKMADAVLHAGVRGVTDLITIPGIVNLDFADIRTVMTKMGKAMMGTGEASGENRAIIACEEAISNPLLDDVSIKGAKGVLVNMTGGPDMTLFEADSAVTAIKKEVDPKANIIFGTAFDENMKGSIRVSVVATGIESDSFFKDYKVPNSQKSAQYQGHLTKNNIDEKEIHQENISSKIDMDLDLANGISDLDIEDSLQDEEFKFANNMQNKEYSENTQIDLEDFIAKDSRLIVEDNIFSKSIFEEKDRNLDDFTNENKRVKEVNIKKDVKSEVGDSGGGFKLFRFMNNLKSKNNDSQKNDRVSQDREFNQDKPKGSGGQEIIASDSVFNSSQDSRSNPSEENEEKIFFDSRIMSNDNNFIDKESIDDDIINVPAFFRRKK